MIRFGCASCGARFKVSDDKAGKRAKCARCGAVLTIPTPPAPEEAGLYRLAGEAELPTSAAASTTVAYPRAGSPTATPARPAQPAVPGARPVSGRVVRCPSCTQPLPAEARICVDCGVRLPSGRPVLTSRGVDLDELEIKADKTIRPLSWLIPTGIYPIYSEALGKARPWATWGIAAVTVVASAWFLALDWSRSPKMRTAKNLMLWCGEASPSQDHLLGFYMTTSYGDLKALEAKAEELKPTVSRDRLLLAAHQALPPEQQCFGRYRFSQLLTYAFLHGGPLHLAGNMLFLLVLGSRVNAAVGNLATLLLYPLLAVVAGWAFRLSAQASMPLPMLGASGAVMGMAGMYVVLFPIHKIHMVAWWRRGLLLGAGLSKKIFALPGILVVLFYISFDVIYTVLRVQTGVAHWAHLGGLIAGVALALLLLIFRLVRTGGDGLSVLLGKYAWPLVGRPVAQARRRAR